MVELGGLSEREVHLCAVKEQKVRNIKRVRRMHSSRAGFNVNIGMDLSFDVEDAFFARGNMATFKLVISK